MRKVHVLALTAAAATLLAVGGTAAAAGSTKPTEHATTTSSAPLTASTSGSRAPGVSDDTTPEVETTEATEPAEVETGVEHGSTVTTTEAHHQGRGADDSTTEAPETRDQADDNGLDPAGHHGGRG